jgi:hypothetical protein
MDVREMGWDGMDCTDLNQDRDQGRALVNMVMNLRVGHEVVWAPGIEPRLLGSPERSLVSILTERS